MVIPDRDPCKLLVVRGKVRIIAIGSMALPVVIETVYLLIWLGDAVNIRPVSEFAVRVFINVVSEVHNEVYRVLCRKKNKYSAGALHQKTR